MAQAIVSICLVLTVRMERLKMTKVDYEVLFNPSKRHKANALTKFGAIDVCYKCPKCEAERVITWMFPDTEFTIVDKCCDMPITFVPKEEE
tara:strand:+ start:3416 stop:3688 length:273 start_codon:yes stop_codon:yes gene_type:complete